MSQVKNEMNTKIGLNFAKGWVKTDLGKVIKIIGGGTPKTSVPEYWDGEIPWLSVVDFNDDNRWVNSTEKTITSLGLEKSSTKLLNEGDIIISARGTVGAMAQLKREMSFNQSCYGIRNIENISEIDFIFYLLKFSLKQINQNTYGAVFDTITTKTFDYININLPPLPEQKAIAKVLTAFDDKIENLRAQNDTLEQTAQTIFTEWFGKYQLEDELPEGWRVGNLNEFVQSSIGGDYGKEDITDDFNVKTICLRGTDLPDMKVGIPQKAPIRFLKASKLEKCQLIKGDIVIEISGGTENQSTGRVMYINEVIIENSESPMTCVNFCRIIRPINPEYSYFIYSVFDYLYNRKVMFNWENGTTGIKNLNLNSMLANFDLSLPESSTKIIEFNVVVKPFFIKIQTNNKQIQSLAQTRDALLPKLMSGELRVKL
jgi:type I restriction enzyme S subunit